MNRQILKYLLIFFLVYPGFCLTFGQTNGSNKKSTGDTLYRPKYTLQDRRMPFEPELPLGLNLKQPSNLTRTIEYDPVTNEYVFRKQLGKLDYQIPYSLNQQEFKEYELKNSKQDYWRERRRSDKGSSTSSFIPKINFGGEAFDKLFGSNTINIVPQGSAELIFGVNTSYINNPVLSERLRKTTTFDFQEKIQMNVTGSIGDKMKLGINYNTEATFDFENKTKLEYTGKEDEIIKKIEAGNVSLPLTGSLITGSQSLFGIKTELQFGKLTVTTVVSQQKGESSTILVKGGAQVSQFEVPIDQYEANKHYFLSQFFRNNYERSLKNLPVITSGITITKIEVWVTNKSSQFQDSRNIVAFMDLGEANPYNGFAQFGPNPAANGVPSNDANGLYSVSDQVRNISQASAFLAPYTTGRTPVVYEKIENARRLTDREFTLQPQLGYISLNASLNANEVLAVAYEYTFNGKPYRVGEFSTSNTNSKEAIVVKLIKNTNFTPALPNWDLMMKNVYSINAYQVNATDFRLNILYQDDRNGTAVNYIPDDPDKKILLKVMKLDTLNTNGDPYPDGVFDYVEGVTVNSSNGRIYFPKLEPFGRTLNEYLSDPGKNISASVRKKYVFNELYDSTQTKARQMAEKNKFLLQGTYQSQGGADIQLNALNVPQGSVVVTAGGRQLVENVDYTVDYTLGRVKIINAGLAASGTDIRVSLESNSLFNFQTKTLVGTHLDYKFSDNFNLGATALHLSERPLTTKVNIGDEPVSNTIWGLNGTYTTKSQLITNILDKIPFLNVKEPSSITLDGEFAHLIPGHSKAINKSGTAFIDDFEGSETPIDMKTFQAWSLASTPGDLSLFKEASPTNINNLSYNFNRAKLAWYNIDPLFLRNSSATPANIKGNDDIQKNPFVMEVFEKDIFKNYDDVMNLASNIAVLNLAYYPKERGPYNYDTNNVGADGLFTNPTKRWGGIQREITQSDFEASNIEFIEFWLMDPYVLNHNSDNNGSLYFDLGDVSEDVNRDSRKQFENGLPTSATKEGIDSTVWGYVPTGQSLVNAFAATGRGYQDVGLDGLNDTIENNFFRDNFLIPIQSKLNPDVFARLKKDPSSDNFMYFRDDKYDQSKTDILGRYKNYNGLENNSPENTSATGESFSNSILPNSEDINRDNTLSENESFYQYKVNLGPGELKIGSNFIVDSVSYPIEYKKQTVNVNWYQFRIPISAYEKVIGGKADFKSIQFMRMFLTGFKDSVILRFARLNLVRSEWRKYNLSFREGGEGTSSPEEGDPTFEISSVNIEENAAKKPINYVLPPGVTRQTDPQNPQLRMLNEQSMVLKVHDLPNGDARAAYKNIDFDVRQYKRLKMDVHAEQITGKYVNDNELTVFIRIGSDYKNNYYEYEIPLKITRPRSTPFLNNSDDDRLEVWPDENRIDIALSDFQELKQARNNAVAMDPERNNSMIFEQVFEGKKGKYSVCGNPNLSNIRTLMIGIRYPQDVNKAGLVSSAEVWVNELRLTDFNEQGGWAANLRLTSQLSDFGSVSVAGNTSTHGFGGVESKINNRSKEDVFQYDLASNLELGKFFPQKSGIQLPMYFGYSESFITPQYNPLDPDIELKTALRNMSASQQREFKRLIQDYSQRKSLNFTNVRINKTEGKPHLWDISNITLNYSYNENFAHSTNVARDIEKHYQGGIMYAYQPRGKNIAPFQNWKLFRWNAFRLIRDFNFNLMPSNLGFRTEMSRSYNETQLRDLNNLNLRYDPMVNKDFLWNRYYDLGFDLTRSLKIDFSASNIARIDEPYGVVNKVRDDYQQWKDSVWNSIISGGRTTHYQQDLKVSYALPVSKLPLLGWTNANLTYMATYDWDAASLSTPDFGNTISNTNSLQLTEQLNFTTLYNKVPYFRRLSQPLPKNQQQKKYKKVTYEKDGTFLNAGQPRSVAHNLSTKDIKVKVLDKTGKEIKGKVDIVTDNKITFTSDSAYRDVKILVEGKVEQKRNPVFIVVDNITRLILGVKSVSISWSTTEGTTLPGFMPKTQLLGMAGPSSMYAPGAAFVFGWQDKNIGENAIRNNWLTSNVLFNSPMVFLYNERLNIRSSLEPIPGLRIELSGLRSFVRNQNSYYSPTDQKFANQQISGNYSISFIAIGNAFQKLDKNDNYSSQVFKTFQNYRNIISDRLGRERLKNSSTGTYYPYIPNPEGGRNGYGLNSQEVLIPAFYAAYGGMDPEKVTLSKFPDIFNIRPNWRLNYDGISKIEFIRKFARTVNLTHSYTATYNIGDYLSNQDYDIESLLSTLSDIQNKFIPQFDISSVSIIEQFSPLAGIDITFINSLSTKLEIRKSRNILLSMANNQISETSVNDIVVGAGYKVNDFKLNVRNSAGNQNSFKSDLNLRADVSIRDNKTILRRLTDERDQPAQGQKVVKINVSADYMISDKFSLRLFYDRIVNTPLVETSFPTANTNIGFSLRFSLAQ